MIVSPLKKIARGRQSQPIEIVVSRGILLDVDVALRDVGFRLVVVVVAHEVAHRILGEESLHLLVELGRERLVVADEQGGAAGPSDDVGHGEGLAGAGGAQKHLMPVARLDGTSECLDSLRLIAGGREVTDDLEIGFHG